MPVNRSHESGRSPFAVGKLLILRCGILGRRGRNAYRGHVLGNTSPRSTAKLNAPFGLCDEAEKGTYPYITADKCLLYQ